MRGGVANDEASSTVCASEISSDYEFVATPVGSDYGEEKLPFRPKQTLDQGDVHVAIYEAPEKDGILVSFKPPTAPAQLKHTPCDVVLTIDVSGSMSTEAPPPVADPNDVERNGLTVLDLVKHAARTIIETMDDTDRLAIVTFSTEAKVVQRLLPMTAENKALTLKNIDELRPESMTNLWHGLMESIKVFDGDERSNCVPAIMVLTDGLPNHMCPPQGYVKKLQTHKLPASLHTFGFGFSLRSGLLKSIAEIGGGNYAFIADSGMLGTVFIHAVANLQSTFATRVSLTITTPPGLTLAEPAGTYNSHKLVDEDTEMQDGDEPTPEIPSARSLNCASSLSPSRNMLTIELDDVRYGQSRDVFLKYRPRSKLADATSAKIAYHVTGRPVDGGLLDAQGEQSLGAITIKPDEIAYHRFRAELCNLLSSIFPLNNMEEHEVTTDIPLEDLCSSVESLGSAIKDRANGNDDAAMLSLVDDLVGKEPSGQIRLAVANSDYFERWGKHYLLSILNAHQKQVCNSFKDNGPLQYGSDSPLFIKCRDTLDKAFDHLPPPTPSRPPKFRRGPTRATPVDMKKYHRRDNPCFAGSCRIRMGDGSQLAVESLRNGMAVHTPTGVAKVAAVVATRVNAAPLCVIKSLRITPWHPMQIANGWDFPARLSKKVELFDGVIYSVLLEHRDSADAHTIEIEGLWATTLGHGLTSGANDVRAHAFFGDYKKVLDSLDGLPIDCNGVLQCGGMVRDSKTGLACGFLSASTESADAELQSSLGAQNMWTSSE